MMGHTLNLPVKLDFVAKRVSGKQEAASKDEDDGKDCQNNN